MHYLVLSFSTLIVSYVQLHGPSDSFWRAEIRPRLAAVHTSLNESSTLRKKCQVLEAQELTLTKNLDTAVAKKTCDVWCRGALKAHRLLKLNENCSGELVEVTRLELNDLKAKGIF